MPDQEFKRQTAYKVKIGDLIRGNPILNGEKLSFVELGDKRLVRINVIGNVIEKYSSEGEKRFTSITIDDATGQIKIRAFGDSMDKVQNTTEGQTILVIGTLRHFNNEIYILPEIVKEITPSYLLVRKLEIEKEKSKNIVMQKHEILALKDSILQLIKKAEATEGIDRDKIIMDIPTSSPELINQELQRMIEDGIIFEPRPGRVRYLG
ncbi:MAG: OB-fold nucleic acid binding domain-containing protein [Nanoarchaeota archaeon]